MQVDPAKIEELKAKIEERREELLKDWTPEKCPEEHREGWLAWEYATRTLKEAGLSDEQAAAVRSVWMEKVRYRFYGTYGAIVMMLSTPTFVI